MCQTDNPQSCFTFCVNIHMSPHIDIAGLTTDTGLTQQFHFTASHLVRLEVTEYARQAYGQHPYGHISSPYRYTNYYKASVRTVCIFPNPRGSFGRLSLGFRQVCSTQLVYRLCPFPTNCPLTYRPEPYGLPPARTTRASPDRVGGRCR